LLGGLGGRQRHAAFPSIFDGVAREHSREPDEFYKIVVDKTAGADRCDLFSRETRPGVDAWGNEPGKFHWALLQFERKSNVRPVTEGSLGKIAHFSRAAFI